MLNESRFFERQAARPCTIFCIAVLIPWLLAGPGGHAEEKAVPDDARSIYAATPPSAFTLYALDPELLAGWNTPLRGYERNYIPERYYRLPVLGGWYGEGYIPDREVLLSSGIKKAFYLSVRAHDNLRIAEALEGLGMDVVVVPGQRLADMAECFRAMGRAFNRPVRGEALGRYAEEALARVTNAMKDLPEDEKVKVYIALERDGLATVCRGSERAEVLDVVGAINVNECPAGTEEAFLRIPFEQLMAYDPDVILIYHPDHMRAIPGDPKWRRLRAVREGRCYFMPRGPFSWLERPASYMRLIGIQWLANKLHPDRIEFDEQKESKGFMKLFFNLDLDDKQIDELFEPHGTF